MDAGQPTRSAPDAGARGLYPLPPPDPLDLSTHGLRQLLGYLGVALPLVCWAWTGVFPSADVPHALSSVSAYYYTSAVWAFVGMLVAMGLFLFTYRGYSDRRQAWDYWVSNFAGAMAILVATFPTQASDGLTSPSWWRPFMGYVHLTAAVLLFSSFVVFCWFLFPVKDLRVTAEVRRERGYTLYSFGRRLRHYWVYYSCGLGIVACLGWAAARLLHSASIFWPEFGALVFFGISWLRKGQLAWTVRESKLWRLGSGEAERGGP